MDTKDLYNCVIEMHTNVTELRASVQMLEDDLEDLLRDIEEEL